MVLHAHPPFMARGAADGPSASSPLPLGPASATRPDPAALAASPLPGAPIDGPPPGEASLEEARADGTSPALEGPASGGLLPAVPGEEPASAEWFPESSLLASRTASATQAAAFPVELIGSQLVAPREPASCWT
jgi:hypothetical protein